MACTFLYNGEWYSEDQLRNIYNQTGQSNTPSRASDVTMKQFDEFLKRMNVDVKELNSIVVNGQKINGIALIDGTNSLIKYSGDPNTVIPEESIHIATSILQQTNPSLYKEMFNKIGGYNIYSDVYDDYKDVYTKDGKPDIARIKKEAIDRLLVEHIILKNEGLVEKPENLLKVQNWWSKIIDFIKGLFNKQDYNPFIKASQSILNVQGTLQQGEELQLGNQDQINLSNKLNKQLEDYGVTKKEIKATNEDEEDINEYVDKAGKIIPRVTDKVREKKSASFLAKLENASPTQKETFKQKAEWGTKFHKDSENIIRAAIDENGFLRDFANIDTSGIIYNLDAKYFTPIQEYLIGKLDEAGNHIPGILYTNYPKGTLFKVEQQVYSPLLNNKKGIAGTIDLLAILPDGSLDITDWKTKFLNIKTYQDIPHYSKEDYNVQLGWYKNILSKAYDVDYKKINAFAQPIIMEGVTNYGTGDVFLKSMTLPTGNVSHEERMYLVPVSTKDQSTGNSQLDDYVKSLYLLHQQLSKRQTDEKEIKNEQLNAIANTIRELQIRQNFSPVSDEAKIFLKAADRTILDINEQIKNKSANSVDNNLVKSILSDTITYLNNISKYTSLYGMFNDIYGEDNLTEKQLKIKQDLKDLAADATEKETQLFKAFESIMQYEGKSNSVDNILDVEKALTGFIDRDIQSTSKLQTYAVQLFYKYESQARTLRDNAVQDKLKEFTPILKEYTQYAKDRGVDNIFTLIQAKNTDGTYQNKLLKKIESEAYTKLDEATSVDKFNHAYIIDNIKEQKFKDYLASKLALRIQGVEREENPSMTSEELNEYITARKENLIKEYDTSSPTSLGWYRTQDVIKFIDEEKWYTKEYKNILNKPAILNMYKFIEELNSNAKQSGYHDNNFQFSKRFLPWLTNRNPSKLSNIFSNMFSIQQEEREFYGKVDPTTGELEKSIPRLFTTPIKDREGNYDVPNTSKDLGLNITAYIKSSLHYQYLSEIEDKVKAIQLLEEAKKHYEVDNKGNIVKDSEGKFIQLEGNNQNLRVLESQVDALLYGRQYSQESGLGSPESTKLIEKLNNYTRLKVFALNFITPFVNTFGGNLQGIINSGKLWKGSEWFKEEMRFVTNAFKGKEGNVEKGIVDYFQALAEDINNHKAKQMSSETLNKYTINGTLLAHLRASDMIVQQATALTMIKNSAIIDGKIVNIREYIRNQDRIGYSQSYEKRKELASTFEQRVEEFKKSNNILSKASFDSKGYLQVEGISRDSQEFNNFRRKIQNEIKNITGSLTEDEKRNMERNILLKSMMMFKGWIPRLTEVRFGQIKKNAATDEYEMGRTRAWLSILIYGTGNDPRKGSVIKTILSTGLLQGFKDLRDMRAANENGLKLLAAYYDNVKQQYYDRTGKELNMTPEEFYDMTRQAIRMQVKDNLALISLLALYFAVSKIPPDDDDQTNNVYKTLSKITDKLHDEVSFYYNPLSFQQIANGSLMPSIGVLSDGQRIIKSIGKEFIGDKPDQNYPIKSILKTIPILNQSTATILPLLSPETAKEFGFRVSSQSGQR